MKHMQTSKRQHITEGSWYGLFYGLEPKDKKNIKRISMIPTNVNLCRVCSDGKSVYSTSDFYPGDIIEICPTRAVDKSSLYSRDMRDIVFEIIPNEYFVVPFGYCQYYNTITRTEPIANCDYQWDEANKTIVIRALNRIPKKSKLILNIRK